MGKEKCSSSTKNKKSRNEIEAEKRKKRIGSGCFLLTLPEIWKHTKQRLIEIQVKIE